MTDETKTTCGIWTVTHDAGDEKLSWRLVSDDQTNTLDNVDTWMTAEQMRDLINVLAVAAEPPQEEGGR